MRIVLAADHAGFTLKEQIKKKLTDAGYEINDVGTNSAEAADYSDYGHPAACKVANGEAERGIFFCGSGAGMSITANRLKGIRAIVCFSVEIARLARTHNNANVLCLAARFIDEKTAWQIVEVFLSESFEGGRHLRRIEKIEKNTSCR